MTAILTLLALGVVASLPPLLGAWLMVLARRASRLRASCALPAPATMALGGFRVADPSEEPVDRRRQEILASYPRWAVVLGWVLGAQLTLVGLGLLFNVAYAIAIVGGMTR